MPRTKPSSILRRWKNQILFLKGVTAMRFPIALLAALCGLGLGIPSSSGGESPGDPGLRFDIAHDPSFRRPSQVVARLVEHDHMQGDNNRFCIVGYRHDGDKEAWVYWPNHQAMILWEPQTSAVADLSLSRRRLDLRRDVVPDDSHVGGSTYVVTKRWVDKVIEDCRITGVKIAIGRHSGK